MKKIVLMLSLLALCACNNLPNTNSSAAVQAPTVVAMRYVGTASIANRADPMNGCRVYAYQMDGYVQTAVLCKGEVTTASNHNQVSDAAADAASQ